MKAPGSLMFYLALAVFVVFGGIVLLFYQDFANGMDGYFYALQARTILQTGLPLSSDFSLSYYLIAALAVLTGDPVSATKLAALLIMTATALLLYRLMIALKTGRIVAFAVVLVWNLSFFGMYSFHEFLRNAMGNAVLLALCLVCVWRRRGTMRLGCMAVLVLAALACHKLTGLLAGGIAVLSVVFDVAISRSGARKIGKPRARFGRPLILRRVLLGLLAAIVCVLVFAGVFRLADAEHGLGEIDLISGLGRYELLLNNPFPPALRAELVVLAIAGPACALTLLVNWFRRRGSEYPVVAIVSIVLLGLNLPILRLDFESLSYRLLLESTLFFVVTWGLLLERVAGRKNGQETGLETGARNGIENADDFSRTAPVSSGNRRRPGLGGVVALFLGTATIIPMVLRSPELVSFVRQNLQPDYVMLDKVVIALKGQVEPGDKLVAHRGLAHFVWYSTGLLTDQFVPGNDDYRRIVYGFGPVHFEDYNIDGRYRTPVELSAPYYLVDEGLWQRFYNARKADIEFLGSWLNPNTTRPDFVRKWRE